MVTNYSVPSFNSDTSDRDSDKLTNALRGVRGVESVSLKPDSNQFEIKGKGDNQPNSDDIMAASKKAGFECHSSDQKKSGQKNSGKQNSGQKNSGQKNSGQQNAGRKNSGQRNSSQQNSGQQNQGRRSAGQKKK